MGELNGKNTFDPSAPVVVGGMGGSGTRVVASILSELGFFMGSDLNSSLDNQSFTLLFKRPGWHRKYRDNKGQVFQGLDILTRSMTGKNLPSPREMWFLLRAAFEIVFLGHTYRGYGISLWPLLRVLRIAAGKRELHGNFIGWGWKEPNSHVYLEYLAEYFKHLKYIHTIRNGLDMAFSGNQQQLYNWGPLYGISLPEDESGLPGASLRFWVSANQRAFEIGHRLGENSFLVVNYDRLCTSPGMEIKRIISFLNLDGTPVPFSRLCSIPSVPKTMGRFRGHNLEQFCPQDIEWVKELGFHVE